MLSPGVCSYIIQSSSSTARAHVRVSFEAGRGPSTSFSSPAFRPLKISSSNSPVVPETKPCEAAGVKIFGSQGEVLSSPSAHLRWEGNMSDLHEAVPPSSKRVTSAKLTPRTGGVESSPHVLSSYKEGLAAPLVGEVTTPFWVQNGEGVTWADPDDLCMKEINAAICQSDKTILWEMIIAIIEHPCLALRDEHIGQRGMFSHAIRNAQDVADIFKRMEYRALWTPEAASSLPLSICADLIGSIYNSDVGSHDCLKMDA